jgi:hypothetical protein
VTDNIKSKPRKGDRVRVTFDATYECDVAFTGATVDAYVLVDNVTHGAPKGATIEPIEDLHPGDVYRDADGTVAVYDSHRGWFLVETGVSTCGWTDNLRRPLTLLVRNGAVVL